MYILQAAIVAFAGFSHLAASAPSCRDVWIDAKINATNPEPPNFFDPSSLLTYASLSLAQLSMINVSGTYRIYGSYCLPEVWNGNWNTLQLLVHGAASSHHYFQGNNYNGSSYHDDQYSWAAYASKAGYPTLAIDRLGHGKSAHPDPVKVVQIPAQVEITHSIVQQVKNGLLGPRFNEVIYVGHSLGSVLGQVYTAKYPNDVKRIILTGWATLDIPTLLGQISGYSGQGMVYYGYNTSFKERYYDPALPAMDLANPGENPSGEGSSIVLAVTTIASGYKGSVLALTGQNDPFWCGIGPLANCGQGPLSLPARAKVMYPNSKLYSYYVSPNTGHGNIYHYNSRTVLQYAQDWLAIAA